MQRWSGALRSLRILWLGVHVGLLPLRLLSIAWLWLRRVRLRSLLLGIIVLRLLRRAVRELLLARLVAKGVPHRAPHAQHDEDPVCNMVRQ